jgi:hypothetical protein
MLLNVWIDIGATSVVLLLAAALLGIMFLFIRAASDDSGKYNMLREMVETIFATPAHLRSGSVQSAADNSLESGKPDGRVKHRNAFQEPCPACGTEVTEQDAICPSCELRLL